MEDRLPRKLAAILYADVAGYSRLTGDDEDATHRALGEHLDLISATVESYGGAVMHYAGDAVLAKFDAVVDAMSSAVAIQGELNTRNADLPAERKLQFRVGVNLGDVIEDRGDIYGDGVNVAARLEALAVPGGICVSDAVRTAVGKKLDLSYEDIGPQQVKNIEEPVRAYKVITDTREAPDTGGDVEPPGLKLPERPSIAVLAFDNMSGDSEQEYFSDGITEDIITELSKYSGLFVIARNSSFSYKGQPIDVKAVAQELGVRYLLEGSVRRSGSRLRVTAQLLDSTSAVHLWAERYDGNVEDIFDFQDEITRNIVGSIAPQIEIAEMARSRSLHGINLSAYELALQAEVLAYDGFREGDPSGVEKAISTAQATLNIDPRSGRALWVQAFSYQMQYLYRWGEDPDAALELAWNLAERLIHVDSANPKAYMCRGAVHLYRRKYDEGIADFQRALSLNPNFALNLFVMAWGESLAGHTKDAREHAHLGLRLSPRDMDMWLGAAYLALAQASFADGDFEETKKWGRLAVQMHTTAPIRRALMIASYAYTGDDDEAAAHATALKSFAPDFIPTVLGGGMSLYKHDEHNQLLIDGLRKAGFSG